MTQMFGLRSAIVVALGIVSSIALAQSSGRIDTRPTDFPRAVQVDDSHPLSLPSADAKSGFFGTPLRGAQAPADLTEADRGVLAGWNANLLRWPLACPLGYDPNKLEQYDAWLDCSVQQLLATLPELQREGLFVVVNLANTPEGRDLNDANLIFSSASARAKYIAGWRRTAQSLAGHSQIWAYDLANEPIEPGTIPPGLTNWHTLATEVATAIREVDPVTAIVVEGTNWASPGSFNGFTPIVGVPGVVYSAHMYEPVYFTHQDVYKQYPFGVNYPGLVNGVFWDKNRMRQELQPVRQFQQTYNVPIYVGEFSAVRWAPNDSAERYLYDAISLFEEYGWNWTYHAFREWSGWSVEYTSDRNDSNPATTPTRRQLLLQAWYCKNQKPAGPANCPVFVEAIDPPSGTTQGGTTVTITGVNFRAGATVSIGGVPATGVTVVSDSQITATTGQHACGLVDVVVTSNGGSGTKAGAYSYSFPGAPTGLSPNGTAYPNPTTSVTLSWAATPFADRYAVRVRDNQDGTIRDVRNNCVSPTVFVCVDGVATTSFTVTVRPGHTYDWWVHAGSACGQYSVQANGSFSVASACVTPIAATPGPALADLLWVDDGLPAGALAAGTWLWDSAQKASGSQSSTEPAVAGFHQHYFYGATQTLSVAATDKLVTYVLLDPCDPPQEVMLQWNDGSWEHRAFWGSDLIAWGAPGTAGHLNMGGALPTGQWIRLEVPATSLGLAGATLNGMAFTLSGGRAWFDRAGVARVPIDDAVFVGQSPPVNGIAPGATTSVSVTMLNTGTTTWTAADSIRLGSQNPENNTTWGLGRVYLAPGETVAPGASKTFTFTITAPTTVGTYNFQWRMLREMVRWFGPYTPNVTVTVAPPVDNACFVSQVAPSSLAPGQTYAASVTMRNCGTTVWSETDYMRLGSQNPANNTTWGLGRVYLAPGETVAPGANKTFQFTITAPSAAGTYNFQWRMVREMIRWFGDLTPNVAVVIGVPGPPQPPTGLTPNGTALAPGSTSVTMSWTPTPGATKYAIRLQDNTDGSLRSTWSCPGSPTIYLCVNDITPNSYTSTVVPGHSYTWWVHAGNTNGYSSQTYASFTVPLAAPPSPPTGLTPNGVALPAGSTSVTMSWAATPGATNYAVRLQDNTDGTLRSTWNCPGTPTIYLCVNGVAPNSYVSAVVPGHSYTWWVHASNAYGTSAPTYASFSVPVAPLHAPTGLYKEASPSRNLVWNPPDNLTGADAVTYDLWIYGGANCGSGCLYHPGAPSWYTMGAEIVPGTYTWTLKANSATRPSSGAVSGPSFTMP